MRRHLKVRRHLERAARLAGRTILRAALVLPILLLLAIGIGPRFGTYRTVTVLTGSMQPSMPAGSLLVVVPVDPSALSVGDVVTYQAPTPEQQVITHRIIEVVEPGARPVIRTQGDANPAPDPWAARITAALAWRVVLAAPQVGSVIQVLRAPMLRTLTLYFVPALLLAWTLVAIWMRPSAGQMGKVGLA